MSRSWCDHCLCFGALVVCVGLSPLAGASLARSADDQLSQGDVERMFGIGAIEAVIAVAPAGDETSRFEFGQFILNGLEREPAQASEFPNVQFGPRIGEKQAKDFRAHLREKLCKRVCRIPFINSTA